MSRFFEKSNIFKYLSTCQTRSDDFWILNTMCMFMYLFVVYFSFAPVISASTHRYVNYFISKSWWWLINRNVNVDFTSWYIHLFGLYFSCYLHTVGFYPHILSYVYIYIYIERERINLTRRKRKLPRSSKRCLNELDVDNLGIYGSNSGTQYCQRVGHRITWFGLC